MLPITRYIRNAINLVANYGLPMTPANVKANAPVTGLTIGQAYDALDRELDWRIADQLKVTGHIIGNQATHLRVPFASAQISEVQEQATILLENEDHCHKRRLAMDRTLKLLRAKQKTLGQPVTPAQFQPQVESIYANLGLDSPFVR